ncbi:MAG: hypothetical protein RIQ81_643 [Pseudomonadota bacterium]|jgi:hypothetical protein
MQSVRKSNVPFTLTALLISAMSLVSACGDFSHPADARAMEASGAGEIEFAVAGSALEPYRVAASAKGLPTPFFDELIANGAWIAVKSTSGGPSYYPGIFTGGTIYHPSVGQPLSMWTASDWSLFYNELFHAWWGNVFMKSASYSAWRDRFPGNAALLNKYRAAHPRDPRLAMEEAWSETAAFILMVWYPRPHFDTNGNLLGYRAASLEQLAYRKDHTVAPVSHSDRPGYTPAAESTYPDESEYAGLFQLMTGKKLP